MSDWLIGITFSLVLLAYVAIRYAERQERVEHNLPLIRRACKGLSIPDKELKIAASMPSAAAASDYVKTYMLDKFYKKQRRAVNGYRDNLKSLTDITTKLYTKVKS